MPALIAFLASLLGSVASWLTSYVGKRVALWVAVAGLFSALWATFWVALQAAASVLASYAPVGPGWDFGLSMIPANATDIVAAVVAVRIARWVYLFSTAALGFQMRLFGP